jgi:hypothetical protein
LPRADEDLSLPESNVCQRLQLSSIHYHDFIEQLPVPWRRETHCDKRA